MKILRHIGLNTQIKTQISEITSNRLFPSWFGYKPSQANVIANAKGSVLIGGYTANMPVFGGINGIMTINTQHDFCGIQQITKLSKPYVQKNKA